MPPPELVPIIVGIVAAGATVVSAAITGICAYYGSRKGAEVVVTGEGGKSLKFPASTPPEKQLEYLRLLQQFEALTIDIVDADSEQPPPSMAEPRTGRGEGQDQG